MSALALSCVIERGMPNFKEGVVPRHSEVEAVVTTFDAHDVDCFCRVARCSLYRLRILREDQCSGREFGRNPLLMPKETWHPLAA